MFCPASRKPSSNALNTAFNFKKYLDTVHKMTTFTKRDASMEDSCSTVKRRTDEEPKVEIVPPLAKRQSLFSKQKCNFTSKS